MHLSTAQRYAESVVEAMAPYCAKIQVAGSIRRQRGECADIDIVLLPQPGQDQAIRRRAKTNAVEVKADGPQNLIVVLKNRVQVDLYFAQAPEPDLFYRRHGNWGTLLLARTGSREFNRWYAIQALQKGYNWSPYRGLLRCGHLLFADVETDMFRALKLDWIPPEARER